VGIHPLFTFDAAEPFDAGFAIFDVSVRRVELAAIFDICLFDSGLVVSDFVTCSRGRQRITSWSFCLGVVIRDFLGEFHPATQELG
jgi:hypothetical protein